MSPRYIMTGVKWILLCLRSIVLRLDPGLRSKESMLRPLERSCGVGGKRSFGPFQLLGTLEDTFGTSLLDGSDELSLSTPGVEGPCFCEKGLTPGRVIG